MNVDYFKIEDGFLKRCDINASGDIVIPDNVREICAWAFEYCCDITSVVIPDTVEKIGESAFYKCRCLKSVTIGSQIRCIPAGCFAGCTNLKTILIPDNVRMISSYAFNRCSGLMAIRLPESLEWIGNTAFKDCYSLFDKPNTGVSDEKYIAYKGFKSVNGELMCRNRIYSLESLNTEPRAILCSCGIHACLMPIEAKNYYDNVNSTNVYYKVELSGSFHSIATSNDTKICATEMKILEEISDKDLVRETVKVLNERYDRIVSA